MSRTSEAWLVALLACLGASAVTAQDNDDPYKPYKSPYGYVVGGYEFAPGHTMVVIIAFGGHPQYIDMQSGHYHNLFPAPDGWMTDSVGSEVRFEGDSVAGIRGLVWRETGGVEVRARRVKLRVRELDFRDGNVKLAGTLILPEGRGPFPAVVVHGGSDWRVREDYIEQAYMLATGGVAALIYDKRGWGGSTGERIVSFATEARDAVAAVQALQRQPEIASHGIGLSSFSQTGWVVPQAAVASPNVRFVVMLSPATTTVARQERGRLEDQLRASGTPEAQIDSARHVMNLKNAFGRTGRGWDEYVAAAKQAKGKPWDRGASAALDSTDEVWRWIRLDSFYNPLSALERLKCPVLAIWGGADTNVRARENAAIMEAALDQAGDAAVTFRIMPNASHFLTQSVPRPEGARPLREYPPNMWPDIIAWVKAHARRVTI